jgi:hypothetical protein
VMRDASSRGLDTWEYRCATPATNVVISIKETVSRNCRDSVFGLWPTLPLGPLILIHGLN